MSRFLAGTERELRSNVPQKTRLELRKLRERLAEGRALRKRKGIEKEIEAFIQGTDVVRAAAKRQLSKEMRRLSDEVIQACNQVIKVCDQTVARAAGQAGRRKFRREVRARTRNPRLRFD